MPYINPDEDYSTWRRVRNIKFISTFCDNPNENEPYQFKKDESLTYEIKNWKQAFMNILLQYYELYTKEGLIDIPEVMETTEEYKKEDNFYDEFIKDNIEKTNDKEDYIVWTDLKKSFEGWYFDNYHKTPPKGKDIKKYFETKYFKDDEKLLKITLKNTDNDKNNIVIRGWKGYKIINNDIF